MRKVPFEATNLAADAPRHPFPLQGYAALGDGRSVALVAPNGSVVGGRPIEVWFADEARVGQKNTMRRRWAGRGTRHAARKDQRTASAYIFGAICPARGAGAGLVMPRCTTEVMSLHLNEIAKAVAPALMPCCCSIKPAGTRPGSSPCPPTSPWCRCRARSPELNPVENLWHFLRDNWLGNRVFTSYADLLDRCCHAWSNLIDQPWRIMSIGLREWAHGC